MIKVLILVFVPPLVMFATHAATEAVKVRLRLAWHRRLTRRHTRMLRRALVVPRGEGWR